MKNIYHFDRDTGALIETGTAKEDPLHTIHNQKQAFQEAYDTAIGEGKTEEEATDLALIAKENAETAYLIPANATDIAPPTAGANEIAVFDGSEWSLVPDFKDTEYYTPEGEKVKIEAIDESVPAGSITETPPSAFHDSHDGTSWIWNEDAHKDAKCKEVESEFLNQLDVPYTFNGNPFQVDKGSQESISKRSLYAKVSNDDEVNFPWLDDLKKWRDANNVDQDFLTPSDYLNFGKAVTEHVAGHFVKMQIHKDSIRALATYEEVLAYDITVNWS